MNDQIAKQALNDEELDQIAGGGLLSTLASKTGDLSNSDMLPSSMQKTMGGISSIANQLSSKK